MNNTLLCILFMNVFVCLSAQSELEIIKQKNQDNTVDVYLENSSQDNYDVAINLDLQNMKTNEDYEERVIVPSDSKVFICTLVPTSDDPSYKVNIKAYLPEEESSSVSPRVIFYSENGKKSSTQVRNYLQKHDISYYEYNVSYNKKTKTTFKNMLTKNGIDEKKVDLPVLVIDDEIYYGFGNVKSFLKDRFNR